ncbi:uncharacterized protein BJX67DRAFT_366107 [Aspergillus lucknowensis]|uniref:Secreted protein n=1 Tax=Aspergillus lucknowensis TaxID=176173 RepID=A0ABR4LDH8_9EURO
MRFFFIYTSISSFSLRFLGGAARPLRQEGTASGGLVCDTDDLITTICINVFYLERIRKIPIRHSGARSSSFLLAGMVLLVTVKLLHQLSISTPSCRERIS